MPSQQPAGTASVVHLHIDVCEHDTASKAEGLERLRRTDSSGDSHEIEWANFSPSPQTESSFQHTSVFFDRCTFMCRLVLVGRLMELFDMEPLKGHGTKKLLTEDWDKRECMSTLLLWNYLMPKTFPGLLHLFSEPESPHAPFGAE